MQMRKKMIVENGEVCIQLIFTALFSQNVLTRQTAAKILYQLDKNLVSKYCSEIIRILELEDNYRVSRYLIRTIEKIGSPASDAIPILVKLIRDKKIIMLLQVLLAKWVMESFHILKKY